jgi:hypothetical protein
MKGEALIAKVLLAAGILPLLLLGIMYAVDGARKLSDPCITWGLGPAFNWQHLYRSGDCPTRTGMSMNKATFKKDLAIRDTFIFLVSLLALVSILGKRPRLGYLAAALLFLVTLVLLPGTFWLVTLFSCLCLVAATALTANSAQIPRSV